MILKPLKKVNSVDKKYYAILWVILNFINEDEKIYENISISPLWEMENNEYYIKISFFEEEVYKRFFDIMSKKINQMLSIDWLPFQFVWFGFSEKWQIFDISQEAQKHYSYSWIKLNFVSPSVIKSSPYYKLLPQAHTYIYSLISKVEKITWEDKFFEIFWFRNTKKIKTMLEDFIIESSYKLETEKVFIKWWYVPWNIWWISYAINKEMDDPSFEILKNALPAFIKWARWTWLGFGTRLWLWQVEWEIY